MSKRSSTKSKGEDKEQGGGARTEPAPTQTLPDPRAVERGIWAIERAMEGREFQSEEEVNSFLNELLADGRPPSLPPSNPLEEAQELMYDAWGSSSKRQKVNLARKALEISSDCADAYVLLAEETTRTLEEARKLFEEGVKAGERALGPEMFEDAIGHFWGIVRTRPYMRARRGLAECLWLLGEHHQAIEHLTDMLRLNPNDNQGLRYILVNWLLEEGQDEAVGKLLKQYKGDIAATWLYSRALWLFRREGNSKRAKKQLRKALEENPFVPDYLLGKKKFPKHMPQFISLGDASEAVEYVLEAIIAWASTPSAFEWLVETTEEMGIW